MSNSSAELARVIAAIRVIERQKQISAFASADAWQRLEEALVKLDGHPLSPSVARRLDQALKD